ncbi:MAG TPA: hypothetical protein VLS48_00830 [Anaerolineales bacterium]|nr:hypothetical protein [Anaerolineales bacterium]
MSLAEMPLLDLIGTLSAFALTLMVFGYLLGDNPLFRIALHLFIGVSAGYVVVMAAYTVLWPQLLLPLLTGSLAERTLLLIPLGLSLLLMLKSSSRLAPLGNLPLAFLVGVGAATVVAGALLGTLLPQAGATINLFERQGAGLDFVQLLVSLFMLLGVLTTLVYFQFSMRPTSAGASGPAGILQGVAWIGQFFIAVTLGALFAGVYLAALAALVERLAFLVNFFRPLF